MAKEDDQRIKDMMRAIELGEIEEDILEGDSEDYDDMGGINSLKNKAPSIKLASETGPEEFQLELMSVIREFNDKKQSGEIGPDVTVDEYINDYFSKKKMMKEEKNRQMAMYGGRMQYAGGNEDPKQRLEQLPMGLRKDTTTGEGKTMFNMDDYEMIKLPNGEVRYIKKDKKAKGGIAGVL
jgi:hypothetical protein